MGTKAVILLQLLLASVGNYALATSQQTTTAAAAATSATPMEHYSIPTGLPLEKLPGYDILNPQRPTINVSITMVPLRITGSTVQFTAPAYRNDRTGEECQAASSQ